MLPVYFGQVKAAELANKMAKVLQRVETTLRSFYVFNSSLGQKEGEVSLSRIPLLATPTNCW